MHEGALTEIADELGIEVLGKNSSGWLVARCPFAPLGFHARNFDRDPSFFMKPDSRGVSGFNCFTCKQKGTVSQLVSRLEHHSGESYGNLAYRARLKELQNDFGEFGEVWDSDQPPEPIDEGMFTGTYPKASDTPRAMEYLSGRGITAEAADKAGLLYDPEDYRVMFPVKDYDQRLFGYSGRSVIDDGERVMTKVKDYAGLRKKFHLLGEHLVHLSDLQQRKKDKRLLPILVVEGLMAYVHLLCIGADKHFNVVATLGSFLSTHQRDRLAALDRPVYFLYDDDLAGDIGLFGAQDEQTGEHRGVGALDILAPHVPTFLCEYPDRFPEGEGDPDKFTLSDVEYIKIHSRPHFPTK